MGLWWIRSFLEMLIYDLLKETKEFLTMLWRFSQDITVEYTKLMSLVVPCVSF